jgi:RNA recognition motif-containing protein
MKIYVGNISRTAEEEDVKTLFEEFGKVLSCVIIKDRFNGESKGFGFVEMENEEEAKAAMSALNSSMFQGKTLTVNQARPREERRPMGGGGGRQGPGGGGRQGGYRDDSRYGSRDSREGGGYGGRRDRNSSY